MRTALLPTGVLAAWVLTAPASLASPPAANHVGVDMRFGNTSGATQDIFQAQPTLVGSYLVAPKIRLSGAWGMAYSSISSTTAPSQSNAAWSNVVLAGHYLLLDGGVRLTAGLGAGIPILEAPSGVAEEARFRINLNAAQGVRGRLGAPLWMPSTVTFFVPVRASVRFANRLWLRGDLDVNAYVPTGGGGTDLGSLVAVDLAYRAGGIIPGARLTGDWLFTRGGDDFQAALEIYLRTNFAWGFARLGFLMNLDSPQGSSFDSGKFWGLGLRAGYKL